MLPCVLPCQLYGIPGFLLSAFNASPPAQALPGDRGFQNFDVGAKKFFNIVKLWGGKVQVLADVAYDVRPEEPNK